MPFITRSVLKQQHEMAAQTGPPAEGDLPLKSKEALTLGLVAHAAEHLLNTMGANEVATQTAAGK